MRRAHLLYLGIATILLGAACAQPAPAPTSSGSEQALEMRNFAFAPASLTVKVGTVLVWTNRDSVSHTVTLSSVPTGVASLDSGSLGPGQTFRLTASQVGRYAYHCSIHPSMTGEIVVVAEQGTPPATGTTPRPQPAGPVSPY
ncbi:MAG: cupredoxin domain-containing protein [Chloroflexi bacterium]|nr:cupredoxin domain-containing protein [Chloroflexota bacterium]